MREFLPGFEPPPPLVPSDGADGDEWFTPQFILDWLPPIVLDPCYCRASLVKAGNVLDIRRGEDGLTDPWLCWGNGVIFCNPPFSDTGSWLRRCAEQAQRLDRIVVCLVPATPGDGPWRKHVWDKAALVGYISGRVNFVNPEGQVETKGRGHALILYGDPNRARDVCYVISLRAKGHAQAPVWTQQIHPA